MKLLLTSDGITNQRLADALTRLVDKQPKDTKIGFIPTAVHGETPGNKNWFVKQMTDLQKFGFNWIDIVELAVEGVDWKKSLNEVDVIYAGGGNPYYLLNAMRKTGFDEWLKNNLNTKVYVGGSSGAIVLTPAIDVAQIESYGLKNTVHINDLKGLGIVDFEVAPHIPDWPSYDEAVSYAKTTSNDLYVLDNESGLMVTDAGVEVVSEGQWKLLKN